MFNRSINQVSNKIEMKLFKNFLKLVFISTLLRTVSLTNCNAGSVSSNFDFNSWTSNNGSGEKPFGIVGGRSVSEGEFPSFITLVGGSNPIEKVGTFCSGVAISKDLVLTAAHCFENYEGKISATTSVHHPLKYPGKDIKFTEVSKVCPSRNYNSSCELRYDYSILRLAKAIDNIEPAILANIPAEIFSEATAVGMGAVSEGNDFPEVLQALDVRIVECENKDQHSTTMCTVGIGGGKTCPGDSGGPIYMRTCSGDVVLGLTSYGSGDCENGSIFYDVNASIANNLSEIEELILECT